MNLIAKIRAMNLQPKLFEIFRQCFVCSVNEVQIGLTSTETNLKNTLP